MEFQSSFFILLLPHPPKLIVPGTPRHYEIKRLFLGQLCYFCFGFGGVNLIRGPFGLVMFDVGDVWIVE